MRIKKTVSLAAWILLLCTIAKVDAAIVDINAITNSESNSVILSLAPGTYVVNPIGIADGGLYNSWNAWEGGSNPPSHAGWLNNYSLSSTEFNTYTVTDNTIYSTDLLALDNALSTSFTLSAAADVNFFIIDSPYFDNLGGMSLDVSADVSAVPIPAAAWLFGTALIGFVGMSRRRKVA